MNQEELEWLTPEIRKLYKKIEIFESGGYKIVKLSEPKKKR